MQVLVMMACPKQGARTVKICNALNSCDCRCPECAPGSIDLAAKGDGRWRVEWVPIPCNVGESTFFYHAVSDLSNSYYYAFSVSNTRYVSCKLGLGANSSP